VALLEGASELDCALSFLRSNFAIDYHSYTACCLFCDTRFLIASPPIVARVPLRCIPLTVDFPRYPSCYTSNTGYLNNFEHGVTARLPHTQMVRDLAACRMDSEAAAGTAYRLSEAGPYPATCCVCHGWQQALCSKPPHRDCRRAQPRI
jgi:hypothetical protein